MKKIIGFTAILFALSSTTFAQENEGGNQHINVPSVIKNANTKKYPDSKTHHITWETEKGNYEANWGGKDGETNSVLFTPAGEFLETVEAIPVNELPAASLEYVKTYYKSAKVKEAGKVTDKNGKTFYEAEVSGKDVIFDHLGNFVKVEK